MTIKSPGLYILTKIKNITQFSSLKFKGLGIAIITLLISASLFWFEASVANRVKQVEISWTNFSREAANIEKVLNEITIDFGYGGLIHNYKNYILRQKPALIPQIQKNFDDLYISIKKYNALNISNKEKKSLSRLKRIIDMYQLKFKLTQRLISEGKTPQEIDIDVQINDSPAFTAINYLANQSAQRHHQYENKTSVQLTAALRFQNIGRMIFIPLVLFAGIILIVFLRKIVRANDTIKESRQQLQDIFESSPDAMLIVNSAGAIIQVNNQVSGLLGYSDDELLGQTVEMLIPKRIRKKHVMFRDFGFSHKDNRFLKGEGEFLAEKKDGTEIAVDIGLNFFGEGVNKQAIVILRDVTEKKKADMALHRSQDVLNKAQSIAHVGSWEWDIKNNTLEWSDEIYRIFGFQPHQFQATYDALLERLHPDDKEDVVNAVNASVVYDQPYNIEHRIIRPDGEQRVVHERGDVFRDDAGEAVHMVGSIQDITNRKLAEVELKLADNVFNHTAEAIVVTDVDSKILRINHAYTVISGYSENEALGKHPSELLKSGQHDEKFYDELWQQLDNKGTWEGEIIDRRKNGELFPSWHNMSVVKDEHGKAFQYISIFSDITEKKRAEEHIRNLAQFDQLTGLPNRTLFNDRLQHALIRANRAKSNVGLMFIDLDRFKTINDTLGHQAGDRLLQIVAKRLSDCVRTQDTVARLGGDEFTIILEDLNHAEDAAIVADKLLVYLSEVTKIAGHDVVPGGSVGISVYPDDGDNAESLVKNADIAMYKAKQQGRNRYQFYTEELSKHAEQRFHMEKKLRKALEHNELEVYYQPQISLKTGKISGAEALVRWKDPDKGIIPPIEFLPFAEETGLIEPIGIWVLERACHQAKEWQDQGLPPLRMSVNVAGYQITHGHIVESTEAALEKSGLASEFLELEITEDFVMDYLDKGIERLKALRKLGVSLAIDDFGTGYSSLRYLKQLPINRLKIDRSFVMDMHKDKDDEAIVSATIAMAKSLGLAVIAEGVERDEHVRFLIEHGCEEAQGYHFSVPAPKEEFIKLFSTSFNLDIKDELKLKH